MTVLQKILQVNSQALVIQVKYDIENNTVERIEELYIYTNNQYLPVGDLLIMFFEKEINVIVDETDWREIFLQKTNN